MLHPDTRLRLVPSLHLQVSFDGTAQVIDDRTFTVSHVNASARLLLEALYEPRTQEDLQAIIAKAADCSQEEAAGPVTRLVAELLEYGWVKKEVTEAA